MTSGSRWLERSSAERSRAIDSDIAKNCRMHHLVDEAHLQSFLRAYAPSGENHIERGLQAHAPRQALRAAHPRNEPELHFRQRERRLRVIGTHAITTCQRQL